jgi:monolysocardiolipin acyltransferase
MRYFKWGIARMILEAEPCPDVLPMWFDGAQEVMSEKRTWPRPVPRPGKRVEVAFGELMDREKVLEPLRVRWRELRRKVERERRGEGVWEAALREGGTVVKGTGETVQDPLGQVSNEELRYGAEAEKLRIEVTLAVRNEVLKVRQSRGLPDEDPKRGVAETFKREGTKREGEMRDRSMVKDM